MDDAQRTDEGRQRKRGSRRHAIRLCGEEVPYQGHICAFFDSRAEKYETLGTYFNDAISAGDCVVNIVDAAARDEHIASLQDQRVPVATAMGRDQLRILKTEETYWRDGELSLNAVLDMVRDALKAAEKEGRCIRTCGDMSWVARTPGASAQAMEYEARVNQLLLESDCTLLCVYDLASASSGMVADILATHPFAVINGRLRPNPNYVTPEEYLQMLRARPSTAT